jgi:hypothetical protein
MLSTLSTKTLKPELSGPLNRVILAVCLLLIIYFGYEKYQEHRIEQKQTSTFIINPKVGDIYFLNIKIIQDKPALKNKYKLAKIVRVGDDGISVVYGNISYQWQHAVVNSIQYGDLRNNNYFKVIPEYIPMQKIRAMHSKGAIYLIKRPTQNKIYDSLIKA